MLCKLCTTQHAMSTCCDCNHRNNISMIWRLLQPSLYLCIYMYIYIYIYIYIRLLYTRDQNSHKSTRTLAHAMVEEDKAASYLSPNNLHAIEVSIPSLALSRLALATELCLRIPHPLAPSLPPPSSSFSLKIVSVLQSCKSHRNKLSH